MTISSTVGLDILEGVLPDAAELYGEEELEIAFVGLENAPYLFGEDDAVFLAEVAPGKAVGEYDGGVGVVLHPAVYGVEFPEVTCGTGLGKCLTGPRLYSEVDGGDPGQIFHARIRAWRPCSSFPQNRR